MLATNGDHVNFCASYFSISEFDPGPWRLVINLVDGADPTARAHVESLVQPGAPVEWRDVKYSWGFLSNLMDHQLPPVFGAARSEQVNTVALDVIADAVRVETRGEQPDLTAMLVQRFGDAVVVVAGPSEAPSPI